MVLSDLDSYRPREIQPWVAQEVKCLHFPVFQEKAQELDDFLFCLKPGVF